MYLGRLASLLFGIGAIFFALCWTPVGGWALFVIATLPMSLTMLASTGADGFTIASAFLLAALVLRLAYREIELPPPSTRLRPLLALVPLASVSALASAIFSSLDRCHGLVE
jgi:uncharacterized membrane protein